MGKAKYPGVRVLIMVVQHTFGRYLNFNCHLHILISAGGLRGSDCRWITRLHLDKDALMRMWRYAVISYLRAALKARVLMANADAKQLTTVFTTQYERWWNIYIDHLYSKLHFLLMQPDTLGTPRSLSIDSWTLRS